MATYDGAAYVLEQLRSVLAQLGPADEVVVVDDGSGDDTVERVRSLGDSRVRVLTSAGNVGYVRAFERALREARGRYLLLCDQDDVWRPGRVTAMVAALEGAQVVATNIATLGGPDRIPGPYGQRDWRLRARGSTAARRNVLGILAGARPYFGSAMGLRRDGLAVVLPFPDYLTESHDLWIAVYGNLAHSIAHLELRSVERRYHERNASTPRPRGLLAVLRSRALLMRAVRELRHRLATVGDVERPIR
jgi:glycosyltransferase involved in cell wall biosynthesis